MQHIVPAPHLWVRKVSPIKNDNVADSSSPGGEVGRCKGLKIPQPQGCAGSSPTLASIFLSKAFQAGRLTPIRAWSQNPDQGPEPDPERPQ